MIYHSRKISQPLFLYTNKEAGVSAFSILKMGSECMDFEEISNLFMRYVIRYSDKSIVTVYNAFSNYLFQKFQIKNIPYTQELLKIALAVRQLSKSEQEKILQSETLKLK